MRVVLLGVIATYLLAIFFTYSRGGLMGAAAVFGLMGWKQKSAIVRSLMAAGLLGLVVLGAMYWQRQEGFKDLSNDTTVNQRLATMKAGIQMFADHPLLGIGPACSMFAYPLYVPPELRCGCEVQLTVHNTVVQVLGEVGILGFLPFMALMGFSLFHVRQLQTGDLKIYTTAIEIALWGFVVCGLSGGFAYTWWPFILCALISAAKYISNANLPIAKT
jgi:O-antigen ligase